MYLKLLASIIEKIVTINPTHINYLPYATTTIILTRQIVREFGLEINIGIAEYKSNIP